MPRAPPGPRLNVGAEASGALSLLVLNKDATTNFDAQIALTDYSPAASATARSFGIPQDEAARTNGPAAAQDIATNAFTGVSATFNCNFPALSLRSARRCWVCPSRRSIRETGGNKKEAGGGED